MNVDIQLVCVDAGGTLGPVNIVADLVSYQYNPYSQSLVSTNVAECMRQHLNECVDFIADLHTINKVKVLSPVQSACNSCFFVLFCFFHGGHGSKGSYDNPQPALRPVLAEWATPRVRGYLCVWVVCGYCHTDSACLVSVRALYCIFIVLRPAASFSRYQTCVPMPDRHRATQAHPPSQQGHSWLVLR